MRYDAPDATCLNVRHGTYYVITKQGDKAWWVAREIANGMGETARVRVLLFLLSLVPAAVSNSVGLIPSECVEVVGQGLVLPGLEPATAPKRSKKKHPKKSPSASTLPRRESPSAGIVAAAEVFARTLADKDEQIEALKKEVETLTQSLAAAKKSNKKLRHRLDGMATCMRCGADVKGQRDVAPEPPAAAAAAAEENGGDELALLVAAGYRRDVLVRFKKLVRSIVMRRRFRKVALDFKRHKASLVMRLRNEALREILTSEQKYVDALQLAVEEFLQPMLRLSAARTAARPVVSRTEVMDIFSTLEIIVELNRGLLNELKERLAQWPSVQRFGDLFARMAPILRLYSGYVRNYDVSQRVLTDKRETSSVFCEFLAEREARTQGLHLESYLIMPVQRLPRYQMLLSGLLKYTDEAHVDFQDLNLAHTRIVEICHEINFQRTVDDNFKVLRALVDDVEGLVEVLGSGGSYFVHRGELHSIMGAGIDKFHYLLFSDVLVKAVPSKRRAAVLCVAEAMPLSSIVRVRDIPDMEGIRHGMEITVTLLKGETFRLEKPHVMGFCALTAPDKSTWIAKINSYLEKLGNGEEGRRLLQESTARLKDEVARENEGVARRETLTASAATAGSPGTPGAKRALTRNPTIGRSGFFNK